MTGINASIGRAFCRVNIKIAAEFYKTSSRQHPTCGMAYIQDVGTCEDFACVCTMLQGELYRVLRGDPFHHSLHDSYSYIWSAMRGVNHTKQARNISTSSHHFRAGGKAKLFNIYIHICSEKQNYVAEVFSYEHLCLKICYIYASKNRTVQS